MKEKGNLKNLIIIGSILIAIALAAYFYFTRDQSGDAVLTSTDAGSAAASVDNELLAALHDLKKIKLDDSIFSNPTWLSLHDFGKVLAQQQPFRPNPFAPLDASAFATSTSVSR